MKTLAGENVAQIGSVLGGLLFISAIFKDYFPTQLRLWIRKQFQKLINLLSPYVQITFPEFGNKQFHRNPAYTAIEAYLGAKSSSQANRLKAELLKGKSSLMLNIADFEEVVDQFHGAKLWWESTVSISHPKPISFYPVPKERRSYLLTFHKKHRELVTGSYLPYVMSEGKAMILHRRQRKLYTNVSGSQYSESTSWSSVPFEHPASFDTLAMDSKKKEEIVKDLITFSKSKGYYEKIGKPWKRGYLLYGPPGTGKSTLIAAMANMMEYDVYDLELTTVKDNTDLRSLLIETTSKSIIVIEDIDCSLDLTGQRKKKSDDDGGKDDSDPVNKTKNKNAKTKSTKITLSGLLNIIDGLWSACESERLFVFTTNYVEKLDPALIRRGRMDMHIEMSYCSFEAFKFLAKNYWDLESHSVFDTIRSLLEEVNIAPADVAENLMPKSSEDDATSRLNALVAVLMEKKEKAKLKVAEKKSEEYKADEDGVKKEAWISTLHFPLTISSGRLQAVGLWLLMAVLFLLALALMFVLVQ